MEATARIPALLDDLRRLLPGGVNSPVRSFAGLGAGHMPLLATGGSGAYVHAVDGTLLVDYIHGWGSVIAGHAHPAMVSAIEAQLPYGLGFGVTTPLECEFATELTARVDLPMVRLLNSGTEAAMTAVRLARAHTGRDLILKFAGCYHGHADSLLADAGSGILTCGVPSSAGVPAAVTEATLVAPYNDAQVLADCLAAHGERLAAIILEPVAGNMNLVVPGADFMATVAEGCARHGALLLSDEVMTGLRATPGLAIRDLYGIEPDLACLGKVIGGGLPVAALAGKRAIMELLAPLGPVYQAGTLAGNPVCLAAGLAAMRLLDGAAHTRLAASATALTDMLHAEASAAGVACSAQSVGGMAGYCLATRPPAGLADIEDTDPTTFAIFASNMLAQGVLLPPSRFEACFVGLAHDADSLAQTRAAARVAFAAVASLP